MKHFVANINKLALTILIYVIYATTFMLNFFLIVDLKILEILFRKVLFDYTFFPERASKTS